MAAMDTSGVLDLFAAPGSGGGGANGGGTGAQFDAAAAGIGEGLGAGVGGKMGGVGGGGGLQKLLSAVGELQDEEAQYEGLSVSAFASKLQQPPP